jgi:hypothetical protein
MKVLKIIKKSLIPSPIYELMRPNINTMRNYSLDSTEERDKIIGEEYINTSDETIKRVNRPKYNT